MDFNAWKVLGRGHHTMILSWIEVQRLRESEVVTSKETIIKTKC